MQRIEIKNFGPIKHVELDINDYTIFIGPQASGKSTIARAVQFFRTLNCCFTKALHPLLFGTKKTIEIRDFYDAICERFLALWDISYLENDSSIKFVFDEKKNDVIEISNVTPLSIQFSEHLESYFHSRRDEIVSMKEKSDAQNPSLHIFLHDYSWYLVGKELFQKMRKSDYIPAGRSVFNAVYNEISPGSESLFHDIFVREYISTVNQIRHVFRQQNIESRLKSQNPQAQIAEKIYRFSREILQGNYQQIDGQDFLQVNQEKQFSLASTSSGQQEAIWILLSALYSVLEITEGISTIIEEPESHLFPQAQQDMMRVLTLLANHPENQIMITTHSPYILTPLNNFLFAHELGQDESKRDAVAEIIDPDLWIDPKRFDCYYVDHGTITSVMDREANMMNLEQLDSASQVGNEEYDKLSALEG